MSEPTPTIEFFEGIFEELSGVSLRRNRMTGIRIVVMRFQTLKAIERLQSFTQRFTNAMILTDTEGRISIAPSAVEFVFGGGDGDDLQRVDFKLEIDRDDHWERLQRFMDRYAEAHDLVYGEPSTHEPSAKQ
jgi:photosystem II Psb28-2 protein